MKNTKECDVLIIGTGIAGLTSAIRLCEQGKKVVLVTRAGDPKDTNTYWAQGGIIYSEDDKENIEMFAADIQVASSNTSSQEAINIVAKESADIVEDLLLGKAKTDFMRDEKGNLKFTREAAHSKDRILYNGDMTGKAIEISLLNYLKTFDCLEILTCHTAIDLITPNHHGKKLQQRTEETKVVGAYVFSQKEKKVISIMSKATILATGGFGSLYMHNSNSSGARGDGHAMAYRAGAFVRNMEFIQFHPTTCYTGANHRRFLISEAVRGEGGVLLNSKKERFMKNYHELEELAPRDVVARAILSELINNKDDCVYLDISHKDSDWIKDRFPSIYEYLMGHNIDMTSGPIPVVPAAHYTCGGVQTDGLGRTNLKQLYAVGEIACTGLHGANRLASTSLLEGLTYGHKAALDILDNLSDYVLYPSHSINEWELGNERIDGALVSQDLMTIKQTMWNYLGLVRSKNRLNRARAMFRELSEEIHKFYRNAELTDELIGIRNAVEVAFLVLKASQRNNKSIGCFYRES